MYLNFPIRYNLLIPLLPLQWPDCTASSALWEIGKPVKRETILISAATGPVSQIAGQVAENEGLQVLRSTGSEEMCQSILNELGFDDAINHKSGH